MGFSKGFMSRKTLLCMQSIVGTVPASPPPTRHMTPRDTHSKHFSSVPQSGPVLPFYYYLDLNSVFFFNYKLNIEFTKKTKTNTT